MAITSSDIKVHLSTKLGTQGDSLTSTTSTSLGKYLATTELVDNTLHNLFDIITGSENSSSVIDYRCVFIRNTHATLTYIGAKVYVASQVSSGASIAIAIDNLSASDADSASAQAAEIANELAAPSGVGTFSTPTTTGDALSIGDLAPDECRAVWIKRSAANTGAVDNDGATLTVFGDSAA